MSKGDSIYLFTDGFQDEFGGKSPEKRQKGEKKYKPRRFKNLHISIKD